MDISISKEGLDPEWDCFLETLPDNLYPQSSLWAKLKAPGGWKHLRLVVREHDRIVGGVQMLLRSLPLVGTVGYVSKGPVIASDDPSVQEFLLNQLDRVARAEHIRFLKVQPAQGAEDLAQRLVERGAQPNTMAVSPLATLRIDLRPDPDDILAQMKKSRREDIRRAERRGVTVRVGTETDIPTWFRLRKTHAELRGYDCGSEDYHYRLWSTLSPGDHFRLFVAEYEGQALTIISYIAFGDVLLAQSLGDSGLHRQLNAPSLLHWRSMLWAKERGYAWYDFGGLTSIEAARAILNGEPIPDTKWGRVARFKRSFGGQLMFYPGVYDISYIWPRRLTGQMISILLNETTKKLLLSLLRVPIQ
jgi:peptidoglycan pentaglycine glycine transferase (the first glycine)